jgi:hypothetical protein
MENSKYYDSARTEIQAPPSSGFFDNATMEPKEGTPKKNLGIDSQK